METIVSMFLICSTFSFFVVSMLWGEKKFLKGLAIAIVLLMTIVFIVTVYDVNNGLKTKELKWYSNESYINLIDDNTVEVRIVEDNEIKIQNFNLDELNIYESVKDENYITFNKEENDDLYLNIKDYELIMEYKQ